MFLTTILKLLHPFMPYVTEEIYSMLPFKDSESIVISTYPKYDSETVFNEEMEEISRVIVDLREIRNLKATNNIKKSDLVMFNTKSDLEYIYKSQLKITDELIVKEPLEDYQSINYKSSLIDITYFFKNEVNKEELEADIKKLKDSIDRRKKLLSNENYVNKAPKNIVDLDREKLKEEEAKLKLLEEQL